VITKEMQQLLFPEHAWSCGIFIMAGGGECDCGEPMETEVKYDDQFAGECMTNVD
jgi:hypothetical protein